MTDTIGHTRQSDANAGLTTLFKAVAAKRIHLLVQYPVNTFSQVVTLYLFFAVVFFGGREASSRVADGTGALSSTLDGVIVGWFLLTMAQAAYFGLASNIIRESQWGTLEQLHMTPYGFGTVVAVKTVWNVVESAGWGLLILALMLLTTGRSLVIDAVAVVPISILSILSIIGVGFVFAGLALVYKRIEKVTSLLQFALIGLIAAPVVEIPATRLLPLVQGSSMLQATMRQGVELTEFPPVAFALLVGTAFGYLLAGYVVFLVCMRVAKRRGVMGHY
ncbi:MULTISPECIES: hypothetical protein [Halomicrobium]|uniref:ABC transporter permease n=2 Tax=Halomicrobium mukohataei TaxID=57705 RepID=C7P013_HALMD|nr:MULTISPECIES: hypothetical protein [Halomicrobium]ACV46921.1 conserved hypothetical protein [Halomicrobium mukohataei DSM 12286]QCD65419.1 ABC transporter permease [Halomicrobium mukohataei]QFR20225.1 ABC transporter permease [Halomicrobium sp. ZPS1]